jgi:hypothetical protein
MTKEQFLKVLVKPYVIMPLGALAFGGIFLLTNKTHEDRVREAQEKYDKERAEKIAEEKSEHARMDSLVEVAVDAFNIHTDEERKEALETLEAKYPELSDKWDEVRRNVYR